MDHYTQKAQILCKMGQITQAMKHLDETVLKFPRDIRILSQFADDLEQMGIKSIAFRYYVQFIFSALGVMNIRKGVLETCKRIFEISVDAEAQGLWIDFRPDMIDIELLYYTTCRAINLFQDMNPDISAYDQVQVDMIISLCELLTDFVDGINKANSFTIDGDAILLPPSLCLVYALMRIKECSLGGEMAALQVFAGGIQKFKIMEKQCLELEAKIHTDVIDMESNHKEAKNGDLRVGEGSDGDVNMHDGIEGGGGQDVITYERQEEMLQMQWEIRFSLRQIFYVIHELLISGKRTFALKHLSAALECWRRSQGGAKPQERAVQWEEIAKVQVVPFDVFGYSSI